MIRGGPRQPAGGGCSLAIFVSVLFYASAIQGALLLEGYKERHEERYNWFTELDEGNASWLLAAGGVARAFMAVSPGSLLAEQVHDEAGDRELRTDERGGLDPQGAVHARSRFESGEVGA